METGTLTLPGTRAGKGTIMKNLIRLGVIAALVLGASGARADHDPYTVNSPHPDEAQAAPAATEKQETPAAPAKAEAGAGGMEPREAIEEDPGTGAHQEWVESIWSSP
jgi:hypothetical protein